MAEITDKTVADFRALLGNTISPLTDVEIIELFREARKATDKQAKAKLVLLARTAHPDSREAFASVVLSTQLLVRETEALCARMVAEQKQELDQQRAAHRARLNDETSWAKVEIANREKQLKQRESELSAPFANAMLLLEDYLTRAGYPKRTKFDGTPEHVQVPSPIMGHATHFVASMCGTNPININYGKSDSETKKA